MLRGGGQRGRAPLRGAEERSPGLAPPLCADLEVLYWKQLKERMAAQRKLQSRAVSWGQLGPLPALLGGHSGAPHRGPGQGGSELFSTRGHCRCRARRSWICWRRNAGLTAMK